MKYKRLQQVERRGVSQGLIPETAPSQTCELFSQLDRASHGADVAPAGSITGRNQAPQSISVLVIDDESLLLEIIQKTLEGEGHVVRTFSMPCAGIEFYEQHWRNIDVVLLDFKMPDMRGDQVYEHLKRINANVSVCLVTSCDANEVGEFCQRESLRYLKKPFRLDDLIQCVKSMHNSIK